MAFAGRRSGMRLRSTINVYGIAGFGLAGGFAAGQAWSLAEFCWSTWLAGLLFAWYCIATAALQSVLVAQSSRAELERRLPFLGRLSPGVFLLLAATAALCAGWLAFRIFGFVFAFYGLFLSVFARMAPESMFGPDGFINSDFYSPVFYLLQRFWPTALGLVVAHWDACLCRQPWKPSMAALGREILRLHVFILALPFLSLLAWMVLGDRFQTVTILLLMALLYLLPRKGPSDAPESPEAGRLPPSGSG